MNIRQAPPRLRLRFCIAYGPVSKRRPVLTCERIWLHSGERNLVGVDAQSEPLSMQLPWSIHVGKKDELNLDLYESGIDLLDALNVDASPKETMTTKGHCWDCAATAICDRDWQDSSIIPS